MPTSQTDIVNFALFLIGEQKLNNPVSKTTKTGRLALAVFNQCRDEMLALPTDWVHFRTRAQLGETPAPTIGTYEFAYALPDNHIRTIATIDVDGDEVVYQYRREVQGTTQVILSNESPAYISYIVRLTDTTKAQQPVVYARSLRAAVLAEAGRPEDRARGQHLHLQRPGARRR